MSENKKFVGGNSYDKHGSMNPLVRYLTLQFYEKLLSVIKKEKFKTLVDIGCGEGRFTNQINQYYKGRVKILAYEYDARVAKLAKKTYPDLYFKQGNILNLKAKADLLISSEVLEHIEDYDAAIDNCKNIAPTCIFSVPNEPLFRIANFLSFKYVKDFGNTPGHVNNWTKRGLYKMLKKHFGTVKITTSSFWNIALCKDSIV